MNLGFHLLLEPSAQTFLAQIEECCRLAIDSRFAKPQFFTVEISW